MPKVNQSDLAERICNLVLNYCEAIDEKEIKLNYLDLEAFGLSEYLRRVYIQHISIDNNWTNSKVIWSWISPEEIRDLIMKKEKLVKRYLEKCDEVWLIVVQDEWLISSEIDINCITEFARNNIVQTGFGKIIFFVRRELIEIPVEKLIIRVDS